MKIYTKTGDKGETALVGGSRVSKSNRRVSAYGTLDELNAQIGYLISQLDDLSFNKEDLIKIQQDLFDGGGDLATPFEKANFQMRAESVAWLETRIDLYDSKVPELSAFILPGGTPCASLMHVARTITRRAEREVVSLMEEEDGINEIVLQYINRLSDYFFVVARWMNYCEGEPEVYYKRTL